MSKNVVFTLHHACKTRCPYGLKNMPCTPVAVPSELMMTAVTTSLGTPMSSSTQAVTTPSVSTTTSVVVENPTSTPPQEAGSGVCKVTQVKEAACEQT